MTIALVTAVIWGLAAWAGWAAWRRENAALARGARAAWGDLKTLAPRVLLGVIAAGFLGRLAPPELIDQTLSASSGALGVAIACVLGALVPGGPVLAYTLAGAAVAAGAGQPQILAFITAWLLCSAHRSLVWEAPALGGRFVLRRVALSLPAPAAIGLFALWMMAA